MTQAELNILEALTVTREILNKMMDQGIGQDQHVFALSNRISHEFNLTRDQALIVIENALKSI